MLRSLPVTESLIAPQRFDEEGSECEKPAKQFRTRLMVRELVEQGYLKRIELSREMDDQRR